MSPYSASGPKSSLTAPKSMEAEGMLMAVAPLCNVRVISLSAMVSKVSSGISAVEVSFSDMVMTIPEPLSAVSI